MGIFYRECFESVVWSYYKYFNMSMEYLSIYLCCLHFISSLSYSFQSTDLLPPWLNLFLGIYSFFL